VPGGHFTEGESDSQVGGFTSLGHGSAPNADETEWTKPYDRVGQSLKPDAAAASPPASEQRRRRYEASGNSAPLAKKPTNNPRCAFAAPGAFCIAENQKSHQQFSAAGSADHAQAEPAVSPDYQQAALFAA